jgi:hypothetical protein
MGRDGGDKVNAENLAPDARFRFTDRKGRRPIERGFSDMRYYCGVDRRSVVAIHGSLKVIWWSSGSEYDTQAWRGHGR